MKKKLFSLLAMLLSLVMMVFIVISMAFMGKFDKNGEGTMI